MVKQIFICDCCGKEIRENFYRMDATQTTKEGDCIEMGITYDFCIDCFHKWTEQAFPKPEEEPEPVVDEESQIMADEAVAKMKRKKIDSGKIIALWNAKWSSYEIAKEMGVSIPTVNKYIKAHLEEGGADGKGCPG